MKNAGCQPLNLGIRCASIALVTAAVVELVDTLALGASEFARVGSSPTRGTSRMYESYLNSWL